MAGEGVHVRPGRRSVHGDVADRLGAVYQRQDSAFAGGGADLLQRQYLARGPVHVGEGDEPRAVCHGFFYLLRRYRRRDELYFYPKPFPESVERDQATRMLRGRRDHLVSRLPIHRVRAEAHSLRRALSQGHILRDGADEPGGGLPRTGVRLCLTGVEADALEVGRAGA